MFFFNLNFSLILKMYFPEASKDKEIQIRILGDWKML